VVNVLFDEAFAEIAERLQVDWDGFVGRLTERVAITRAGIFPAPERGLNDQGTAPLHDRLVRATTATSHDLSDLPALDVGQSTHTQWLSHHPRKTDPNHQVVDTTPTNIRGQSTRHVDGVVDGDEARAPFLECFVGVEEVQNTTGEAVDFPDDACVEVGRGEQGRPAVAVLWAIGCGRDTIIDELTDDLPPSGLGVPTA
jgi:hypothetical protein